MQKLFIWGTGDIAKQVMEECASMCNYEILGFIDNNVEKSGQLFYEKPVYQPDILNVITPDTIVVLTNSYSDIYDQILKDYPQYSSRVENKNYFYKQSLLCRYADSEDAEIRSVINYIRVNGLDVFNYPFKKKYDEMAVDIIWDDEKKLFYTIHFNRRMYFSKKYEKRKEAEAYYRSILLEQDEQSPHKYLSDSFQVEENDIVVDVGAAEGNFSLEIIDRVKKIYLIESDPDWIEALKLTFSDYIGSKVEIIRGFISSYNELPFITLDSVIKEPVNFIKMDIEGNEWDGLKGGEELIRRSRDLKLAICSYHSDFDQTLIESFFERMGITHEATEGYMWFPTRLRQTYVSTSLNRAIIRGYKK